MPKSNQSRQKILDSAKDLIWTCGYRGTSVDDICAAAGVRKGSFYHFFPSKEALTVAALEDEWQQRRPDLERLFFPDTPPMERLQGFFDLTYQQQRLAWERNGQVPGCALFVIGCETSPDFPEIRKKVNDICGRYQRLLASAISDAMACGLIPPGNPARKTTLLFTWYEGCLMQARIANDLDLLREMSANALRLLEAIPENPATTAGSRHSESFSSNF
jgi:TetR/AcrR family transcriptional repressor of nem operon